MIVKCCFSLYFPNFCQLSTTQKNLFPYRFVHQVMPNWFSRNVNIEKSLKDYSSSFDIVYLVRHGLACCNFICFLQVIVVLHLIQCLFNVICFWRSIQCRMMLQCMELWNLCLNYVHNPMIFNCPSEKGNISLKFAIAVLSTGNLRISLLLTKACFLSSSCIGSFQGQRARGIIIILDL